MAEPTPTLRPMRPRDLGAVERIYTAQMRAPPEVGWRELMHRLLAAPDAVALVAELRPATVVGYLVGEVRPWEYGSPAAGWVFAVGVDPPHERHGLGRALLEAARARFAALGVSAMRTMVRRDDVEVLRFFRDRGFVAGAYVELERGI